MTDQRPTIDRRASDDAYEFANQLYRRCFDAWEAAEAAADALTSARRDRSVTTAKLAEYEAAARETYAAARRANNDHASARRTIQLIENNATRTAQPMTRSRAALELHRRAAAARRHATATAEAADAARAEHDDAVIADTWNATTEPHDYDALTAAIERTETAAYEAEVAAHKAEGAAARADDDCTAAGPLVAVTVSIHHGALQYLDALIHDPADSQDTPTDAGLAAALRLYRSYAPDALPAAHYYTLRQHQHSADTYTATFGANPTGKGTREDVRAWTIAISTQPVS